MTLREYLYTHNMTVREFAKFLGFNEYYISRIMRGKHKPSEMFSFRVNMCTKGEVKEHEIQDKIEPKKVKNLVV